MTNPTQGIDLLPCPFCGKQPASNWFGAGLSEDDGYWGIDCCNAHAHDDCEEGAARQWNTRLQPSRAASEPAPKDNLMWSRPEPNWRKDIAGWRLLSDGRREFLMHNEALCWPYYVAIDGEYVADSPSPKEPQPEGIGWPVGWCSSCDRMTSAGTVGDGKPCCDKCGDWLIFAGPNDDEEQVATTGSQPPSPAPQAVELPPLIIRTHDVECEPWDIRFVDVPQAEDLHTALTEARQAKDEAIEARRLTLNKFAAMEVELAEARRENERLKAELTSCADKNRQLVENNEKLGKLVDKACDAGEKFEAEVTRLRDSREKVLKLLLNVGWEHPPARETRKQAIALLQVDLPGGADI